MTTSMLEFMDNDVYLFHTWSQSNIPFL